MDGVEANEKSNFGPRGFHYNNLKKSNRTELIFICGGIFCVSEIIGKRFKIETFINSECDTVLSF